MANTAPVWVRRPGQVRDDETSPGGGGADLHRPVQVPLLWAGGGHDGVNDQVQWHGTIVSHRTENIISHSKNVSSPVLCRCLEFCRRWSSHSGAFTCDSFFYNSRACSRDQRYLVELLIDKYYVLIIIEHVHLCFYWSVEPNMRISFLCAIFIGLK